MKNYYTKKIQTLFQKKKSPNLFPVYHRLRVSAPATAHVEPRPHPDPHLGRRPLHDAGRPPDAELRLGGSTLAAHDVVGAAPVVPLVVVGEAAEHEVVGGQVVHVHVGL